MEETKVSLFIFSLAVFGIQSETKGKKKENIDFFNMTWISRKIYIKKLVPITFKDMEPHKIWTPRSSVCLENYG